MTIAAEIDPYSSDLEPLEPLDQAYQPLVDHIAQDMASTRTYEATFGTDPIQTWRSSKTGRLMIIDGHHRLKAAQQAGVNAKLVEATRSQAEQMLRLRGRLDEL